MSKSFETNDSDKGKPPTAENLPSSPLRAVVVSVVIGVSCAGVMFVYNLPGALALGLEDEYQISSGDIATLMTAYTLPSTVTAVIAAQLLALLGLNSISVICSVLVLLGSLAFALAPHFSPSQPMSLMIGAQLINGSGDPLGLACSPAMVSRWWRHNHSGLAMGTTLMVTQLVGSFLPFILLPRVQASLGLGSALWVGTLAQLVAFAFLVLYIRLERCNEEYLRLVDEVDSRREDSSSTAKPVGFFTCGSNLKAIPVNAWLQIVAVCLIPVTQYVSLALLPAYLSETHGMSAVEAGDATSMVWWFCVTAPLWGMVADSPYFGRLHIQLVGAIVAASCFLCLGFGISEWWVLVTMGLSFAMLDQNSYVCVEALVPDPTLIDFAYGVMGAVFNVGLGSISYLAGRVSMEQMPFIYASSLGFGIVITALLLLRISSVDGIQKGLLPRPRPSREDARSALVHAGQQTDA